MNLIDKRTDYQRIYFYLLEASFQIIYFTSEEKKIRNSYRIVVNFINLKENLFSFSKTNKISVLLEKISMKRPIFLIIRD